MTHFTKAFIISTVILGLGTAQTLADQIAPPEGEVILTISGAIATTNVGDTLQLDRQTFAAIDDSMIETTTVWTDGLHQFQGVSLHALTELLGVSDGTLLTTAINDYTVEIPVADAVEGGPIIAHTMDGAAMSVREKGPLWVIYPFDSNPDYRTAVIHGRSIWQLDRIEVVE